jgi:hypothetical protein
MDLEVIADLPHLQGRTDQLLKIKRAHAAATHHLLGGRGFLKPYGLNLEEHPE